MHSSEEKQIGRLARELNEALLLASQKDEELKEIVSTPLKVSLRVLLSHLEPLETS